MTPITQTTAHTPVHLCTRPAEPHHSIRGQELSGVRAIMMTFSIHDDIIRTSLCCTPRLYRLGLVLVPLGLASTMPGTIC